MTTTTCDICGINIPNNKHTIAKMIQGRSHFQRGSEVLQFSYELKVEQFQFNCTNFALCKQCLINAVAKSVAEMVAAEKVIPALAQPTCKHTYQEGSNVCTICGE